MSFYGFSSKTYVFKKAFLVNRNKNPLPETQTFPSIHPSSSSSPSTLFLHLRPSSPPSSAIRLLIFSFFMDLFFDIKELKVFLSKKQKSIYENTRSPSLYPSSSSSIHSLISPPIMMEPTADARDSYIAPPLPEDLKRPVVEYQHTFDDSLYDPITGRLRLSSYELFSHDPSSYRDWLRARPHLQKRNRRRSPQTRG